jgi:hypothetical protein
MRRAKRAVESRIVIIRELETINIKPHDPFLGIPQNSEKDSKKTKRGNPLCGFKASIRRSWGGKKNALEQEHHIGSSSRFTCPTK